jgi:hypothetical protein
MCSCSESSCTICSFFSDSDVKMSFTSHRWLTSLVKVCWLCCPLLPLMSPQSIISCPCLTRLSSGTSWNNSGRFSGLMTETGRTLWNDKKHDTMRRRWAFILSLALTQTSEKPTLPV